MNTENENEGKKVNQSAGEISKELNDSLFPTDDVTVDPEPSAPAQEASDYEPVKWEEISTIDSVNEQLARTDEPLTTRYGTCVGTWKAAPVIALNSIRLGYDVGLAIAWIDEVLPKARSIGMQLKVEIDTVIQRATTLALDGNESEAVTLLTQLGFPEAEIAQWLSDVRTQIARRSGGNGDLMSALASIFGGLVNKPSVPDDADVQDDYTSDDLASDQVRELVNELITAEDSGDLERAEELEQKLDTLVAEDAGVYDEDEDPITESEQEAEIEELLGTNPEDGNQSIGNL